MQDFTEKPTEKEELEKCGALKRARLTIVEYDLFCHLTSSLVNEASAKAKLNECIAGLDVANLVAMQLNPLVWSFVQKVVRGHGVRAP